MSDPQPADGIAAADLEAAARAIGHAMITRQSTEEIARAAWPLIAAAERRRIGEASYSPDEDERAGLFRLARADGVLAERARLAAVISPEFFRKMADWLDTGEWSAGSRGGKVQRDLRRFADLLAGAGSGA